MLTINKLIIHLAIIFLANIANIANSEENKFSSIRSIANGSEELENLRALHSKLLQGSEGLLISGVKIGSEAERAGIQVGDADKGIHPDIIVSYAGHPISSSEMLVSKVKELSSHSKPVELVIIRNHENLSLKVNSGALGIHFPLEDKKFLLSNNENLNSPPASTTANIEVNVQDFQTNKINTIAYSPDGRIFASGSSDGTISIWDAESGRLIKTLAGNSSKVLSINFSPDGKRLLTGSFSSGVKEWDIQTGQLLRYGINDYEPSVLYSSDGKLLIAAGVYIKIWSAKTGKLLLLISPPFIGATYTNIAITPDGRSLLASSTDNILRLIDLESQNRSFTFTEKVSPFDQLKVSNDGSRLTLKSLNKNVLEIWDIKNKNLLESIDRKNNPIKTFTFSPDNTQLLIGGGIDNSNGDYKIDYTKLIVLWDINTRKINGSFIAEADILFNDVGPSAISYSHNGRQIVAGYDEGKILRWDVNSKKILMDSSSSKLNQTRNSAYRAEIPLKINNQLWTRLKDSNLFSKLPNSQSIDVRLIKRSSNKNVKEKTNFTFKDDEQKEIRNIGNGWVSIKRNVKSYLNGKPNHSAEMTEYWFGNIHVGTILGGKQTEQIENIEIFGDSFYPIKIDSSFGYSVTGLSNIAQKCRVGNTINANILHPNLKGGATEISCIKSSDYLDESEFKDYYIDSLGIFASLLGVNDMALRKVIIPTPGYSFEWTFDDSKIKDVIEQFDFKENK